jgi:hypothetical protein
MSHFVFKLVTSQNYKRFDTMAHHLLISSIDVTCREVRKIEFDRKVSSNGTCELYVRVWLGSTSMCTVNTI